MRCRHFFSFALVVFSVFCFGLFTTQNSYAVEDISFTFESGVSYTSSTVLFPNCDSTCFSSYRYLIVEVDSPYTSSSNLRFLRYYDNFGTATQFVVSLNSPFSIYDFSTDTTNFTLVQITTLTTDLTITLTDSYQSCPPSPSGDLSITENGTYDVTNYSSATVNVASSEIIQGNYHDDLVNINQSIIVCGAILLVLYFFYCIYRLIIKNSGVR